MQRSFFKILISMLALLALAILLPAIGAASGQAIITNGSNYSLYLPFITAQERPNSAPLIPNNPSPADQSTNVNALGTLTWLGGDPDGDTVYYDIYMGGVNPPVVRVAQAQTALSYTPVMSTYTTYYWRVVAKDEHGLQTNGPVWRFTTGNADLPEMVTVPAGNFTRGCVAAHNDGFNCRPDELPAATIYLDAFSIDTIEVTNAAYAACVADAGCSLPSSFSSDNRANYYGNPLYDDYPVVNVTWAQANAYCTWAGKRLPTEAEWEKAARGASDQRAYPWGDSSPLCSLANFNPGLDCIGDTAESASYFAGASPYGALNMAGNVYEWVNDWYASDYYASSPSSNPSGPASGEYRAMRGGSAFSDPIYLRVVYRDWYPIAYYSYQVGFRCAASAP